MGWLTKFFRGSTHNISEGQYNSRPAEETAWNEPSSSPVVTDILSEFNNEDIDRAIALSLLEEEQRRTKPIEKDTHLEEDEQLARAIQESLNVESPPRKNGGASGGNTYQPPRQKGSANGSNAYQPPRENGTANGGNTYQPLPFMFSSGFSFDRRLRPGHGDQEERTCRRRNAVSVGCLASGAASFAGPGSNYLANRGPGARDVSRRGASHRSNALTQ